jgi:hypothetical protein
MKMGWALYPMFAANRRSGVGGNFGYVRGKRFKTENIVDYTSAEEDGFSWKEAYSEIDEKKSILLLSPR